MLKQQVLDPSADNIILVSEPVEPPDFESFDLKIFVGAQRWTVEGLAIVCVALFKKLGDVNCAGASLTRSNRYVLVSRTLETVVTQSRPEDFNIFGDYLVLIITHRVSFMLTVVVDWDPLEPKHK